VLGNAAEAGVRAVWNGPVARAIRRRYIDGEHGRLPLCGSCRVGSLVEVAVEETGRRVVGEVTG
jgi:hypothetical protein